MTGRSLAGQPLLTTWLDWSFLQRGYIITVGSDFLQTLELPLFVPFL
jgi:hypothetical protein